MILNVIPLTFVLALFTAQQHEHSMPGMEGMPDMQHDAVQQFLMQQASGTSADPAATPHAHLMTSYENWMLMGHGLAFVSQVVQTGPRGDDALFSTNWVMGMADRPLAGGHLMLRSMLSLEPLTVPEGGYPELFQTGETFHGEPIVDAQHPHNFFMELAAEFAVDLGNHTIGFAYAAPVGDPALGPVAFPHRGSAAELPQATLAHHVQDSTHIANSVITLGVKRDVFGLEFSGFHGEEPGENRWQIGGGSIDSWALRGTWTPTPKWSAQISTGHLENPEAAEPGNVQRTTASLSHFTALHGGDIATSVIYGRNDKQDADTNSITAETNWRFNESNYVTGRLEFVEKDELGVDDNVHTIRALTVGYTKDVYRTPLLLAGIGGNVTLYGIPSALESAYGSRPRSFYIFARLRNRSGS
jgi:hypothetical protein